MPDQLAQRAHGRDRFEGVVGVGHLLGGAMQVAALRSHWARIAAMPASAAGAPCASAGVGSASARTKSRLIGIGGVGGGRPADGLPAVCA